MVTRRHATVGLIGYNHLFKINYIIKEKSFYIYLSRNYKLISELLYIATEVIYQLVCTVRISSAWSNTTCDLKMVLQINNITE